MEYNIIGIDLAKNIFYLHASTTVVNFVHTVHGFFLYSETY